jgi:paraquat-inducible protein B
MPRAKTRKRKWNFPFVWTVPVVAALVAAWLVYQRAREFGPTITIRFSDASGVKPGQTPILYRGADIGQVSSIALSSDQRCATVTARLRRHAASVAREDSVFWIVRPQLGMGNFTGLGTIITGPYIEVLPGKGKEATKFRGVPDSPTTVDPTGLKVVLLTSHGGSLRAGVPVYYRGIEVGAVREARLSTNAATVEIHCAIRRGYAPLVRAESRFWNVTGLDVRVGLFSGAEVNVESLKSLFIGGIAFATPEETKGGPVEDGMVFPLYDEAEKEWLEWAPRIAVVPEKTEPEMIESEETHSLQ